MLMSLLTPLQHELRQTIADALRDDSNAVRIHIDLSKYLAADPDNLDAGLWTDTVDVPTRDIKIEVDGGNQAAHQHAHDYLIRVLELKVKALIPGLCREILDDAAARATQVMQDRTRTIPLWRGRPGHQPHESSLEDTFAPPEEATASAVAQKSRDIFG